MKFNIELMKNVVPFCVNIVGRTKEEIKELEVGLAENCGFEIYENSDEITSFRYDYYGVDQAEDILGYDTPSYFSESSELEEVMVFEWNDILLESEKVIPEAPKVERDCAPIPPVGTICQASVFGKGELVTGEIIKIRHNGTREVAAIMDSESFELHWSHKFYPIPKEPTWQDEVSWFLANSNPTDAVFSCDSWMINDVLKEEEVFLEMCRIALRTKGEIE